MERTLKDLKVGKKDIGDTIKELRVLPYEDLGFAKPDTHRAIRRRFPEVIYCPGKTNEQIVELLHRLTRDNGLVLATRATLANFRAVKRRLRETKLSYNEKARIIIAGEIPRTRKGIVLVVTAGTSDIPVAEEAAITAKAMGTRVERLYDVGVAGVHRLLNNRTKLDKASVLVVVAGMEGALPSVVSGLVDKPVIAVPTSVGYGANFSGLAALLAMMNSCSPGVAVVNIDNGFGAGYMAAMITNPRASR